MCCSALFDWKLEPIDGITVCLHACLVPEFDFHCFSRFRFRASMAISFVENVCDHECMFDECVQMLPKVRIEYSQRYCDKLITSEAPNI